MQLYDDLSSALILALGYGWSGTLVYWCVWGAFPRRDPSSTPTTFGMVWLGLGQLCFVSLDIYPTLFPRTHYYYYYYYYCYYYANLLFTCMGEASASPQTLRTVSQQPWSRRQILLGHSPHYIQTMQPCRSTA
ncbi:hypothetical protein LX36DRAFT_142420 [Colletotrichum falcatum]|nr:hypothetical protein LX36DRAFT_142420 [Colletotrichum falcatum]